MYFERKFTSSRVAQIKTDDDGIYCKIVVCK